MKLNEVEFKLEKSEYDKLGNFDELLIIVKEIRSDIPELAKINESKVMEVCPDGGLLVRVTLHIPMRKHHITLGYEISDIGMMRDVCDAAGEEFLYFGKKSVYPFDKDLSLPATWSEIRYFVMEKFNGIPSKVSLGAVGDSVILSLHFYWEEQDPNYNPLKKKA